MPPEIFTSSVTRPPAQFSPEERDRFAALVAEGDEVSLEGLPERIAAAERLTLMFDRAMTLCGVAALKHASDGYRSKVFENAESGLQPEDFPLELGWVVVHPDFRGKRLGLKLVDTLLKSMEGKRIYATARLKNDAIRRTLRHFEFQTDGTHYRSTRGPYDLVLYVRDDRLLDITGPLKVRGQFHGSLRRFENFETESLRSLGFHFGDLIQAQHFAGKAGFIYKTDLTFTNCLNLGKSDWGWTSAAHIALFLHFKCLGHPRIQREWFVPFLGEGDWSSHALPIKRRCSDEKQKGLIALLQKCGFDGVKYVNNWEPPESTGRTAYFVISPTQIQRRDIKNVSEYHD